MNETQATDPIAGGFAKYDILIEVKTLCRKAKTTTWAELVENGFKIGDHEWGEDDLVINGSGEGHARMALLASYMTDQNHFLSPVLGKAILPELEGMANGLGHIVLVGHKEGVEKPKPLITLLFEFSQKPGEKIKVSKSVQAYFEREAEINKDTSLLLVRDLYKGLEIYKSKLGGVPLMQFENTPDIAEHLRGRRFSPCLTRHQTEVDGKKHLVVNIREHTTEPEGISPPYLFRLSAEEGADGALWLTYEGDADPTEEQRALVREVVLYLRAIVYSEKAPREILTH